jgi:hypothetical protein
MWPASASRLGHLRQHLAEGVDRDLAFVVQDLDEARHVRALEVVRQVHVHVEVRDRVLLAARAVLDPDRVADVLDADLVDRDAGGCRRGPARPRRWSRRFGAACVQCHGFIRSHSRRPGIGRGARQSAAVPPRRRPATSARWRAMLEAGQAASARQSSRLPCSMAGPGCRCAARRCGQPWRRAPRSPRCRRRRRRRSPRASRCRVCRPRSRRSSASSSGLTKRMLTTVASSRSPILRAGRASCRTRAAQSAASLAPATARPTGSARHLACTATPGPGAARIAHRGRAVSVVAV